MVLRQCGKRYVITVAKLLLFVSLFVMMGQMTYLHTINREESRSDLIRLPATEPKEPDIKDTQNNDFLLRQFPDLFFKPPNKALVYGKPREMKGFLTIAIPTVQRPNTKRIYLYDTLNSILEKIPEAEHHQITIVVMVSDTNQTYNYELSRNIYSRYKPFCDTGTIHIIKTLDCIYPDLSNVKKTFNDSQTRLKWRAKQNIDFAFLMLYSRSLSNYYIQLEDDVLAAENFTTEIRKVISASPSDWFLLEFCRLGFIGKLFRSADLEFVSDFLLRNYDSAPGDLLLGSIRVAKGQKKPIHSNYSLFQHIGRFSSLKNKLMPSLDNTFKGDIIYDLLIDLPLGNNPPAMINTSMETYDGHLPEHAYDGDNTTFFWAKTPRKRDHFTLTFEKPHNFSRIIILSGELRTKKDSFLSAVLYYSQAAASEASANETACVNRFKKLVDLVEGEIDTKATGTDIPSDIKCLRLYANRKIRNWVIIRDIRLFLEQ